MAPHLVSQRQACYTRDGRLDHSFRKDGKGLTRARHAYIAALAIQDDGKIIVAADGFDEFIVLRYTADGRLDARFGKGGKVTVDFGARTDAHPAALAVQDDGGVVVAGWAGTGDVSYDFALARLTHNGLLDRSFGSSGKVLTGFRSKTPLDIATAVTISSNGRILAAGKTTPPDYGGFDLALARYTTDGRLDPSFGTGGKVRTSLGWNAGARAVAVQATGKIIVAGAAGLAGRTDFALARFTPSGKLDPSFGIGE